MLQNKYFQTKTNQPMTTDNGKRDAFPSDNDRLEHGLSKREYFAAMVLQSILSTIKTEDHKFIFTRAITSAIGYADELLKQLQNE